MKRKIILPLVLGLLLLSSCSDGDVASTAGKLSSESTSAAFASADEQEESSWPEEYFLSPQEIDDLNELVLQVSEDLIPAASDQKRVASYDDTEEIDGVVYHKFQVFVDKLERYETLGSFFFQADNGALFFFDVPTESLVPVDFDSEAEAGGGGAGGDDEPVDEPADS